VNCCRKRRENPAQKIRKRKKPSTPKEEAKGGADIVPDPADVLAPPGEKRKKFDGNKKKKPVPHFKKNQILLDAQNTPRAKTRPAGFRKERGKDILEKKRKILIGGPTK